MRRRLAAALAGALMAAIGLLSAFTVAAGTVAADRGRPATPAASADCAAPPALLAIGPRLRHAAARIRAHLPLTIIAVGSSSTLGVGATAPQLSYPSRLEAELRARFPAVDIRVVNRGRGGEDAPEELARLDRDVIAEHPDLVIWQVGTNAVLRRDDLAADDALIRRGLARLRDGGSDIVLMDLQYAPRVIARPAHMAMQQVIAAAAEDTGAGLFRRFAIMRYWLRAQAASGAAMTGPDGLHMSDRGYDCLAIDLAEALAANWQTEGNAEALHATATAIAAASAP